jgi:hypothetical protein
MIQDVRPGSRIRILIFTHPGSRIQDSGVKKAPGPGSRAATLIPALRHSLQLLDSYTIIQVIEIGRYNLLALSLIRVRISQ